MINNLGSYSTIENVWADHPEGGREGDYVTVGGSVYYWDKYSRCWVQTSATPSGGGGSQVIDGDLSISGNLGVGGNVVINGTLTVNGVVFPGNSQGGGNSGTGQLVFKSIVFKRSASRPATPQDGAFGNPVPSGGWYDSVPQGTDPIWMSSRYFTSDNERPAGVSNDNWNVWSTPALMSDSEDFDVEFSTAATSSVPSAPPENESDRAAAGWYDPVRDPSANWSQMKWMATRNKYLNDSGVPTWTAWKIMLIKGEDGDPGQPGTNGDGFRSVYAKAAAGVIPTITSQGYPPTGNVTWRTSVASLSLDTGDVLWMSEKRCTAGVWGNWSEPIRINGTDGQPGQPGNPGADGVDIEFIYKRSNSLPGATDYAPQNVNEDDDIPPGGWEDNPSGVDLSHKYEWMCQRTKPAGYNQSWGPWIGPFVWSAYGEQGMDGDGVEYIYRNNLQNVNAVIGNPCYQYTVDQETVYKPDYRGDVHLIEGGNPEVSNNWRPDDWDDSKGTNFQWNNGRYNKYGEWIPTDWNDDPQGVSSTNKEEYVSTRKRHKGVWSDWSTPTLWATYSAEHTITIDSEGYWCIDGQRVTRIVDGQTVYVKAEGADGTGVSIEGSVDYLTDLQKNNNIENITNPTSLEGVDVTTLEGGECYIVEYVSYDSTTSTWTKKGFLYFYNGGTSATYTDNWKELGQFRGEAGQSQYMHIAWATNVDTSGATPVLPSGASWCWAYEDRNSNLSYDWMGIRVDDDPNDSQKFANYEWHYIKGVDGASQEFVYVRTQNNTNPGISNAYTDSNSKNSSQDEYLPSAPNGASAGAPLNAAVNRYEYTDDPKGVGVDPTNNVLYKYEWMSKRKKKADGTWDNWSTPALWSVYAEDGKGIESVQDYYMLSMKYKGVTLNNTSANDWGTEYLEPTAELPYLWHYTHYEYSDGNEYTSPCEIIATFNVKTGDNLLNDTDFLSLAAMPAWTHKGDLAGNNVPDPEEHTVEVVAGTDGHNAFSVTYQGSTEDGYIEYLCQDIYSDTVKKIKPDSWYTISLWMKGVINTDGDTLSSNKAFRLDLSGLADIMDTTSGVKMYRDGNESNANTSVNFAPAADGSWTYHTLTFKTKAALTGTLKFRLLMFTRLTRDTIQVCMPKLELGRMATPYNLINENTGPTMRTSAWAAGVSYMQGAAGEPYIDVVSFGGSWYRCKRSHTSSSTLTPSNTDLWDAASGFKFVATELLLAQNGSINLLASQVINLYNTNGDKTASINADQQGSYCIYYPSGKKRMEFCYDGWIYYYNDDAENTIAWTLGQGGNIIKTVSISMTPITLSTNTINVIDATSNLGPNYTVPTSTRYVYSNDQSEHNGKVYNTSGLSNNNPTGQVIADGVYAAAAACLLDVSDPENETYYLPVVRITGGKIVRRWNLVQLSGE